MATIGLYYIVGEVSRLKGIQIIRKLYVNDFKKKADPGRHLTVHTHTKRTGIIDG